MAPSSRFSIPEATQSSCPLFNAIPAEIRDRIFEYALQAYDDSSGACDTNAYYQHPGYVPPKIDTALLQTCQKIYSQAWYRPMTSNTITLYCDSMDQLLKPPTTLNIGKIQRSIAALQDAHAAFFLPHLRIFAQGTPASINSDLIKLIQPPVLHSRILTVTGRFCWDDSDFFLCGDWITKSLVPDAVSQIRIELEYFKCREPSFRRLVVNMCRDWRFLKRAGEIMTANIEDCEESEWTGSSTFDDRRWVGYESAPNTLTHCVHTVVFKVDKAVHECKSAPNLLVGLSAHVDGPRFLRVQDMRDAGVHEEAGAEEAIRLVEEIWARDRRPFGNPDAEKAVSDDNLDGNEWEEGGSGGSDGEEDEREDEDSDFEL